MLAALAGTVAAGAPRPLAEPAEAPPTGPRTFGALTLPPYPTAPAFCGQLKRRLDPSGRIAGNIFIAFMLYPHIRAGPAAGTIVAQE